MVQGNPGPWFVRWIVGESILWASLIHLLALLPELGTLSTVARVRAEAVDTLVLGRRRTTFVSLMYLGAFSTIPVLVAAVAALVSKLVTTETPYRFLMWTPWHHAFIKDIRTLFQNRVGRFYLPMVDS